jgi:D-glycero-D-manno-heptose 1,7-bisphosphate phosphatase
LTRDLLKAARSRSINRETAPPYRGRFAMFTQDALTPAVFLDRDGTLNRPPSAGDYIRSPAQVELLRGAGHAVGMLRRAGYLCVVVSNQRGVALGLMTEDDLAAVDMRVRALVGGFDASYYCTHSIGHECDCRKPEPGLLLHAAEELGIDLSASWMIGHQPSDLAAGAAAGCRALQVQPCDFSLLDAAHSIIATGAQPAWTAEPSCTSVLSPVKKIISIVP